MPAKILNLKIILNSVIAISTLRSHLILSYIWYAKIDSEQILTRIRLKIVAENVKYALQKFSKPFY